MFELIDSIPEAFESRKEFKKSFEKLNEELKKQGEDEISKKKFKTLLNELKITSPEEITLENITNLLEGKINDYLKKDEFYTSYPKLFQYTLKETFLDLIKGLKYTLKEMIDIIDSKLVKLIYEYEREGMNLVPGSQEPKFVAIMDSADELNVSEIQKGIKEHFGENVNYSKNCFEVSKYIYDKLIPDKENAKVLSGFIMYSLTDDGMIDFIKRNSHAVLEYKNTIYDFTNNQYSDYGLATSNGVRIYEKISPNEYVSDNVHILL